MIGSESVPPKTASVGAGASIAGSLLSAKSASVTEAQANDKEAIAIRAKRDLNDFMIFICLIESYGC